eukprot:352500-Chlamydomonas_euryale.AAC.8
MPPKREHADTGSLACLRVRPNCAQVFVQLLAIPCNTSITVIDPVQTEIFSCSAQFVYLCCSGPQPNFPPFVFNSPPSPPPSPIDPRISPPPPRPPRPPGALLPPSPPSIFIPPPPPKDPFAPSPPPRPVPFPPPPFHARLPPPPSPPCPPPAVQPPPTNLNLRRQVTVLTEHIVGGVVVKYGYVELTLCPAMRTAITSMMAELGFRRYVDWNWEHDDPGCKVGDAAVTRSDARTSSHIRTHTLTCTRTLACTHTHACTCT